MLRVEDTFWIGGWKTESGREEKRDETRRSGAERGREEIQFVPSGAKAGQIEVEQGRKLKVPHVVILNLFSYKSVMQRGENKMEPSREAK